MYPAVVVVPDIGRHLFHGWRGKGKRKRSNRNLDRCSIVRSSGDWNSFGAAELVLKDMMFGLWFISICETEGIGMAHIQVASPIRAGSIHSCCVLASLARNIPGWFISTVCKTEA